MDLGTLIAAALLSLGIIGSDAVLNADNISFRVEVSKELADAGYTDQLVDALLDTDMKQLVDFHSIVSQPSIRSADERTVVGAIADSVNLREITGSFQTEFGLNQVKLTGSLMGKEGEFRFLMTGNSAHTGKFTLDLRSKPQEPLPEFLKFVALEVVGRVEPYAAALFDFNERRASFPRDPAAFEKFNALCEGILSGEGRQHGGPAEHASFHNLIGMAAMLSGNLAKAEEQFALAVKRDPTLGVPSINLALLNLGARQFDRAIDHARDAAATPFVQSKQFLLANARTIAGLAKWGKQDLAGAQAQFAAAVREYPDSFWGYYYWSQLQARHGNQRDAEMLRARAERAFNTFETYPEVAFVYLRIDPARDFAFAPIDVLGAHRVSDIETGR